ncbi:hypothetical protein LIER_10936 [Lithospermum erythrorhizon]|uniref:Gag-pol polyprotein n=1 Tax=Lithospermum erythrorhizon TaxID=34254 RepID=A0AAV3PRA7_LITER
MKVDKLIGSLLTYEMKINRRVGTKVQPIALKSTMVEEEELTPEELAFFAKNMNKIFRQNNQAENGKLSQDKSLEDWGSVNREKQEFLSSLSNEEIEGRDNFTALTASVGSNLQLIDMRMTVLIRI